MRRVRQHELRQKGKVEDRDLRIGEVLEKIDEFLAPHLYPVRADGSDPRICPTCGKGRLHLKTARSGGAFIGCGSYPDCRYTRAISGTEEGGSVEGRVLGLEDGLEISLRTGRFGPYVQKGEATTEAPKPPPAWFRIILFCVVLGWAET